MIHINDLFTKYDYAVPRYTSYPPANHFNQSLDTDDYIRFIKESNNCEPQNISVYIHIPFCKKLCYYCGCNSHIMQKEDVIDKYINSVIIEINNSTEYIDKKRNLSQIHFGGGTPNSIDSRYLNSLVKLLLSKFSTIDKPEIAIELNPSLLTYEYIDSLIEIGFNRFSLGIQDFDQTVLENVNRDSSVIPIGDIVDYIKNKISDATVNFDFIYGLPGQSVESFLKTIDTAVSLKPDRLVTFSYAHVPWMNKNQLYLETKGLPLAENKVEMFRCSKQHLLKNEYHPIGLDHYVLKKDELYTASINYDLHRNFQGYCTRRTTGQVYAFGVSSISQFERSYIQNIKDISAYIKSINDIGYAFTKCYNLSNSELIIREVINHLMCNLEFNPARLSELRSIPEEIIWNNIRFRQENLKIFEDDNIIERNQKNFKIKDNGLLFIRNVAAELDPNFERADNLYSKPV